MYAENINRSGSSTPPWVLSRLHNSRGGDRMMVQLFRRDREHPGFQDVYPDALRSNCQEQVDSQWRQPLRVMKQLAEEQSQSGWRDLGIHILAVYHWDRICSLSFSWCNWLAGLHLGYWRFDSDPGLFSCFWTRESPIRSPFLFFLIICLFHSGRVYAASHAAYFAGLSHTMFWPLKPVRPPLG